MSDSKETDKQPPVNVRFRKSLRETKRLLVKTKSTSGLSITADRLKRIADHLDDADLLYLDGVKVEKRG